VATDGHGKNTDESDGWKLKFDFLIAEILDHR